MSDAIDAVQRYISAITHGECCMSGGAGGVYFMHTAIARGGPDDLLRRIECGSCGKIHERDAAGIWRVVERR